MYVRISNHKGGLDIDKYLTAYGFDDFFNRQSGDLVKQATAETATLVPARIIAVHKERFTIVAEHGEKTAVLKSSIFYGGRSGVTFDHPCTGDFVLVRPNPFGEDLIYALYKRKSKFERLDGWNGHEQVVAVNFDYVLIVSSLNKDFSINRIERYIAAAWESGGTPVLVLTKSDLMDPSNLVMQAEETAIGIDVISTSVISGEGIERISTYFKPGKTSVLLGSSGVGKSSLVNAVAGCDVMKVNTIRDDDDKGRHTTTHRQLIMLDSGAMIIDTPGMRELGVWDCAESIDTVFSDVDEIIKQCRFGNCTHKSEPGCAVRAAIKAGTLTVERLNSYNKLKKEAAFSERKERLKLRFESRLDKKKEARQFQSERHAVKSALRNPEQR